MNSFTLVIGSKNYSSWSLRGWLAMRQLGAAFEEIFVPFHTEDRTARIRAQSPSGLVPVLKHGDLVINDSLAIRESWSGLSPPGGSPLQSITERTRRGSINLFTSSAGTLDGSRSKYARCA